MFDDTHVPGEARISATNCSVSSAGEHGESAGLVALRPYQRRIARAVLRSALLGQGLSFSVLIARQGGKNELSAQVELLLLLINWRRAVDAIKCAPTFEPQGRISLRRLWQRLGDVGLAGRHGPAEIEGGNTVRLGSARQRFLSAEPGASVVGHTAGLLLEVDEAQDVDGEKFDRDFRPMGATGNATTVYYGTAWDETCLLAQMRERHRELERRDGVQRHFEVGWEEVARYNPAYATYVAAERERLGEEHPIFQTQYLLRTLPGAGRLFSTAALALLQGGHPRLRERPDGEPNATIYVGGLDVGGETLHATRRDADSTVLVVARVAPAPAEALVQESSLEIVQHYAWQGAGHAELAGALAGLVRDRWRLRRLVIDATGVGEGLAAALAALRGGPEVLRLRLTQERKSSLGYALQAATAAGRLRLHAADSSAEFREFRRQLERARAFYRANRTLAFDVDAAEGHDDYLLGLAFCVEAATGVTPRAARGRRFGDD